MLRSESGESWKSASKVNKRNSPSRQIIWCVETMSFWHVPIPNSLPHRTCGFEVPPDRVFQHMSGTSKNTRVSSPPSGHLAEYRHQGLALGGSYIR